MKIYVKTTEFCTFLHINPTSGICLLVLEYLERAAPSVHAEHFAKGCSHVLVVKVDILNSYLATSLAIVADGNQKALSGPTK